MTEDWKWWHALPLDTRRRIVHHLRVINPTGIFPSERITHIQLDLKPTPTPSVQGAEGAFRVSNGKARLELVSHLMMEAVARVGEEGLRKYPERNWEKGLPLSCYYASLLRHLLAWWGGEDLDAETGLPHVWHVAWNAQALVHTDSMITSRFLPETLDNRPTYGDDI